MKISAFLVLGLVALSLNTALALQCPPGYYSTNGLLPGVPAEPGYYVLTSGATNPTPASPGYYVPDVAATNQILASAGTYCPISGMSAAIPASSGYYVPASGAASMTPASPGFYAVGNILHPGNGSVSQTPASPGTYCPIAGMSAAIPASPGYYVPVSGAANMIPAPVGEVVPTSGADAAVPVQAGQYAPIQGMQAAIILGDANGDGKVDQSELNAVLTNYWPNSPWVSMTNATMRCDGYFQFALTNSTAWNFSVLVSSNLTSTNWDYLGAANPVYEFLDPAATNGSPQRFYRLRWP